jgi:hypothetical protein
MTLKEEKIQDDRIRRTPAIGCRARTPSLGVRPCGSGVRHGVVRSSRATTRNAAVRSRAQ